MSYDEYKNEFNNAQKNSNAPYRMFVFDLKGSKKMGDKTRFDAQIKSVETMKNLAKTIQEIEMETGKKILFNDERVKLNIDFHLTNPNLSNPCVTSGDSFVISVFNGIYTDKEIFDLFLKSAEQVKNVYAYSVSAGNFETTDYALATKKCYNGYCMAELCFNKKMRQMVLNEHENIAEFEK